MFECLLCKALKLTLDLYSVGMMPPMSQLCPALMQTMLYFPSVWRLASATATWVPCALVDRPINTNIDTNAKDIAGQSTTCARSLLEL